MARTKRKMNVVVPVPVMQKPVQKIYHAGGYARLSVKDNGKSGSDTMANQKEMIQGYIESQPDMEFSGMFCDNGQTGVNFERPQFEQLMEAVKKGKINCIVVKDLSRFGRNYRETGNYLERVFPFLGVRFIAIADQFDTLNANRSSEGYIVPLKNIINEVYSKDISRKVGSALAVKQCKGEFIGTWAAYGYRKCADDHHQLKSDPETAPVVQAIFQWRLSGMSYAKIARKLNEQGIPAPARYHYLNEDTACERYADAVWNVAAIKRILSNQVYLGHIVQGRKRESLYEGKKQQILPEHKWIVVKHTHEPLIDEEVFWAVRKRTDEIKTAYKERIGKYDGLGKSPNLLKGLVYCADCGRKLVRYKSVTCKGSKVTYFYICPSYSDNPESCPKKYIPETELFAVLWDVLRKQVELAGDLSRQVENNPRSAWLFSREAAWEREVLAAVQEVKRTQMINDSLYPKYAEEKILTKQEYVQMKQVYREQIEQAKKRLEAAEEKKKAHSAQMAENLWLNTCLNLGKKPGFTSEMAHSLLSRVEIDADNQVLITLNYQDEYQVLVKYLEGETAE